MRAKQQHVCKEMNQYQPEMDSKFQHRMDNRSEVQKLTELILLQRKFFGPRYIGDDFFVGPSYIGDDDFFLGPIVL
jgi:hypothetical protein